MMIQQPTTPLLPESGGGGGQAESPLVSSATSSASSFKTIDNNLLDSSDLSSSSSSSKRLDMDDCADLNQILNETLELTKLLATKGGGAEPVALAEAEVDEDEQAETSAAAPSVRIDKIISELNKRNSTCLPASAAVQVQKSTSVVLSPEERISNEAKEYWATIDLYNNSKLAFNKRCKSVKQKREKLNAEWEQRQRQQHLTTQTSASESESSPSEASKQAPEICTCVKCSIVYHEALIRGITDVNAIVCNKCSNKLIYCRCCSSAAAMSAPVDNNSTGRGGSSDAASSISTSSSNVSCSSSSASSQLDDKIFSIKNELVSLSETSLDVFQLLLQLSDTMLELNSQMNATSSLASYSANQQHMLAFSNFLESTGLSSCPLDSAAAHLSLVNEQDAMMVSSGQQPDHYDACHDSSSSVSMAAKIRSVIETSTYLAPLKVSSGHSRLEPPGPMSPRTANSITSIINSLNKKAETDDRPVTSGQQLTTGVRRMSTTAGDEAEQLSKSCSFKNSSKPASASSRSSYLPAVSSGGCASSNLFGDKTSVTQFVDHLLQNSAVAAAASDHCPTTADDYSIDGDCSSLVSAASKLCPLATTTSLSLVKQKQQQSSSLINSKLNEYNMSGGSFRKGSSPTATTGSGQAVSSSAKSCVGTTMKSSSSSTSSSGGSSSLCFSSNIDLTSLLLPSTSSSSTNIVDGGGTVSRRSLSSVKSAADTSSSSADQSYRHSSVSNTVSSSGQASDHHQSTTPPPSSSSSSSSCSTCTSAFEMVNNLLDSVSSFDDQPQPQAENRCNTLPKDKSPARPVSSSSSSQPQRQVSYKPSAAAAMPSHRSNSVNYKNNQVVAAAITNHQLASVVAHDASLQMTNRKPSFKFESSILNRVQTMNLNKIKCLNNKPAAAAPVVSEPPATEELDHSPSTCVQQQAVIKRRPSLNRQPIIAMPTSSSLLKVQQAAAADLTNKHLVKVDIKSGASMSIDSGIYVPPEQDDSSAAAAANLPSISLVH